MDRFAEYLFRGKMKPADLAGSQMETCDEDKACDGARPNDGKILEVQPELPFCGIFANRGSVQCTMQGPAVAVLGRLMG